MAQNASPNMYIVKWRDGFKVGLDRVDSQHKQLFHLVMSLHIDSIESTLDALLDYVVEHFGTEQELMEQSGYPDYSTHLKSHEEFAESVADFLGSGETWSETRLARLRRFLNKWLIRHIMVQDLRFGRWYQQNANKQQTITVDSSAQTEKVGWLSRLLRLRTQ